MIDIPALVSQLNTLTSADLGDDAERKSPCKAARAAAFISETPEDSIHQSTGLTEFDTENDTKSLDLR